MRHLSLSLAALALAACGGGNVDPDARMPAPHPEGSDGSPVELTAFENAIASTEVSENAIEGEWSTTSIDGNPAVAFADTEGTRQVAVICQQTGEDQPNSLTLRRYVEADVLGENSSIDVYTSAGSKSYQAASAPTDVTVSIGDYFATMIGSARGDIRIMTGTDLIVVPAGEAVRTLVSDCRPEMEYQGPEAEDNEEDSE